MKIDADKIAESAKHLTGEENRAAIRKSFRKELCGVIWQRVVNRSNCPVWNGDKLSGIQYASMLEFLLMYELKI